MAARVKTPLRTYQQRICSEVQTKNAIVVLPTGAGKTLIAAELARLVHARRAATKRQGRTLFLVPTVMLVSQQAAALEYETALTVQRHHGALTPPTTASNVLVATPVAYMELMAQRPAAFGLCTFDLVVFDEVCSLCMLAFTSAPPVPTRTTAHVCAV